VKVAATFRRHYAVYGVVGKNWGYARVKIAIKDTFEPLDMVVTNVLVAGNFHPAHYRASQK
jgi:hypothetical protein